MDDLEEKQKAALPFKIKVVTNTPQKSKMAVIIMQIRRPLTMRLIIFNHDSRMFAVRKYELQSCLNAKNENYGSSLPEAWNG